MIKATERRRVVYARIRKEDLMPGNEKSPQKRGTSSKTGVNSLPGKTTQDQRARDTNVPGDTFENDPDTTSPTRMPTSAIRLNQPGGRRSGRDVSTEEQRSLSPIPPRRSQRQNPGAIPTSPSAFSPRNTTAPYPAAPDKHARKHVHWLFYVGFVLMAMITLWALGVVVLNWSTNIYNNFTYGYPRTFQTDAVVGHHDSKHNPSHFIAVNLHGQIIIVEFAGGDPSLSRSYIGPDLAGSQVDLLPVTLSFSDFYHTGKVDMIVNVGTDKVVYCNNGNMFFSCDANGNPLPTPGVTPTP